ncbi:MAG: O-antigen ligase family protein, partial [Propylenella sp.]
YGMAALYLGVDQVPLIDTDAYEGSVTATFVSRNSAATYFAIGLVGGAALLGERMEEAVRRGAGVSSSFEFVISVISSSGVYLLAAAFLLSGLLSTGSRAGSAAGLAGLLVVALASWRPLSFGRGRLIALLLVGAFLVGIAELSSNLLVERLEEADPAADVRFPLYEDTLRMIADRPLLGHGAGAFADVYPLFQGAEVPASVVWNRAHNSYLQAAAELGAPMLVLIVFIAAVCLWRIAQCAVTRPGSAPAAMAALGAFVIVALHSLVDFSLQIQAVGLVFAAVAGAGYGEASRLLAETRTATSRKGGELRGSQVGLATTPGARFARRVVLTLLAAGICVMLFAAARLALVVSATPAELWLTELAPFVAPAVQVDARTSARAEAISQLIADPALTTARLRPCEDRRTAARAEGDGDVEAFQEATRACLDIVDVALGANPLSGELWLHRTRLLFQLGTFGPELLQSLQRSYETSPRVGWIAADRVILGLQVYRFLPDHLRDQVRQDIELVLAAPHLADRLIAAFVANESFRRMVLPVVETLGPDAQDAFVSLVRDRIKSDASRPQ